jgi:tRNA pseudouridine synthase 10
MRSSPRARGSRSAATSSDARAGTTVTDASFDPAPACAAPGHDESVSFPLQPDVLSAARRALPLGLCPECFGRLFGRHGHGLSNPERARRLSAALGTEAGPFASGPECALCRGAFHRWDTWIDRARVATDGLEWHRFTCGSRWDPELLAREESIWIELGSAWGESARGAFNREWGKRLEARTGGTGTVERPDVVLLADLPAGRVEVTALPLYFVGRYRKLDRTLPQTRWPCRRCRGLGCDACGGTGKTYTDSVEELIAGPVLAATRGVATRFHGMGREDIDARMLGDGRPFVLEIRRPARRTVDVRALAAEIGRSGDGRVEVPEFDLGAPEDVLRVKEATPDKSYRVVVRGESGEERIMGALDLARGRAVAQRTPKRVAHRRADRVRARRIVAARLVSIEPGRFTLDLRAEAGTYIKEWIEGDDGRTEPSLSALLGAPLNVESLDVLQIHDRDG